MIRPFFRYGMLLLMVASGAVAGPPNQTSRQTVAKPAWLWTAEERIARRVDPAAREARRARGSSNARSVAPGFTPIDGSIEPELFLPVELVTRLVLNTDAPHERARESYRGAIASRGWDYEHFWNALEIASAPYRSLMQQSAQLQRQARGRADLSHLAPQICAASVDLLNRAYQTFGKQEFDEFLYRNVAPSIRSAIADGADTADALRRKDSGCR